MVTNSVTEKYETLQNYSFFYNTLNSENGHMDSISDEFFNDIIPNRTPNRSDIIENCKKLNNYIIRSITQESYDTNVFFHIINYWLNDQMRSDSDEKNNLLFNWYKGFLIKNKNMNTYVSKFYYIDNRLFKKNKELYELYDNYDKLFSLLDPFDNSKCFHLSNIVNDYNNIIQQYLKYDNSNFPDVLKQFRSTFENQADVYIKSCGHTIPPFKAVTDKPDSTVHEIEHSQQITGERNQFHSQTSENVASTFTLTLFGTSVGTFLILMLIYKITLFRYKLRNKKNKNMILVNNLDDEPYELPVYTSNVHEGNSQYSTHNLTYQSVEN
ncbi:PIR Superfamily Protein [Plasmodium ovale wallikeri]|uniref:PIR Superfamily Protein n=1 Tax=Plasmodium ovale wallikeri TaxID=864142 RepID=A0A1A9AFK7_PLAOA|nr:PIR Superfamily Protein [Plasmodium ovale wallikeri]SBT56823.1 PIR Superfamily Protein [Plasmodium ovale wallikeri]